MIRPLTLIIATLPLLCTSPIVRAVQDRPIYHWVGMFPSDLKFRKTEQSWIVPVYDSPTEHADELGRIEIRFESNNGFGPGLTAKYNSHIEGENLVNIEPHLYDPDWGYGPFFHLTVLDQEKSRFKVRLSKSAEAVWADFGATFGKRNIAFRLLEWDGFYTYDGKGIVVEHINLDSVVVRKEQDVDMWCGDESLEYAPYTTWIIDDSDWIDEYGRSRFDIRYTRGC